MGGPIDDILIHYGVKGMRWGFRKRADGTVVKSGKRTKSEDHTESRKLLKKRPSEMSNSELRKLNERLQLEQTYSQLVQKQGSAIGRGQNYVKTATNLGKTASDVYNLANSPMGKAVRTMVEESLKK